MTGTPRFESRLLAAFALLPGLATAADIAGGSLPFRQEPSLDAAGVARIVLALLISLGIGIGALYLFRRRLTGAGAGGARRVEILETRQVTRRSVVVLLRVDGQRVLLAEHPGGTAMLPLAGESKGAGDAAE